MERLDCSASTDSPPSLLNLPSQAAKEAEHLVLEKMKCQDYLILCVEDTTDWKHSTTRNVVMQADPDLRRTVLVTTKVRGQTMSEGRARRREGKGAE